MLHSRATRTPGSAPRTAAAIACAIVALCGVPPVATGSDFSVVMHAPVRGQFPTPNRNLTKMPVVAGVLAGEAGLEPTAGDYVHVIGPGGGVVSGSLTARESGDSTLITAPVSGVARGWYLAHWNVTSSDGHKMGGDDGAWWAFGHRATTVQVKKPSTIRFTAAVVGGGTLSASMNGVRTGLRTLTVTKVPGTVYAARWTLQAAFDGGSNPQFSWDITTNTARKTALLSGIVPRAGTYVVSILVTVKTPSGTSLNEYSATVRVTS